MHCCDGRNDMSGAGAANRLPLTFTKLIRFLILCGRGNKDERQCSVDWYANNTIFAHQWLATNATATFFALHSHTQRPHDDDDDDDDDSLTDHTRSTRRRLHCMYSHMNDCGCSAVTSVIDDLRPSAWLSAQKFTDVRAAKVTSLCCNRTTAVYVWIILWPTTAWPLQAVGRAHVCLCVSVRTIIF